VVSWGVLGCFVTSVHFWLNWCAYKGPMATSSILSRAHSGAVGLTSLHASSNGSHNDRSVAEFRLVWQHRSMQTLRPPNVLLRHVHFNRKQQHVGSRKSVVVQAAVSEKTEKHNVNAKDVEEWNKKGKLNRLEHLEEQALETLKHALYDFERPAFPCALITGDVVSQFFPHSQLKC
jgi:hypothetical protein